MGVYWTLLLITNCLLKNKCPLNYLLIYPFVTTLISNAHNKKSYRVYYGKNLTYNSHIYKELSANRRLNQLFSNSHQSVSNAGVLIDILRLLGGLEKPLNLCLLFCDSIGGSGLFRRGEAKKVFVQWN